MTMFTVFCYIYLCCVFIIFFFKQKTAYEMRISDWSSDVCSSDLRPHRRGGGCEGAVGLRGRGRHAGPGGRRADRGNCPAPLGAAAVRRSAERRVGKECVCTCSSRWAAYH